MNASRAGSVVCSIRTKGAKWKELRYSHLYFIAKDSLPIYVVYVTVFAKRNHLGANLDLGFAYDLNVLFFLFTTHVTVLR